jgi:zeaxanthin glucosyltransferase
MAMILFDMFPAHGHYNGSMGLARVLDNCGHEVYYACSGEFQQKVAAHNYKFYLIDPLIIFPFKVELKEKGLIRFLLENISGILHDKKQRQIEEKVKLYDEMIVKLRPDLIILDEHFAYKSIFYWKYSIPMATLQTALSPDYAPSIPPFHSTIVPQKSKISYLIIEFIWKWELMRLKIKELKEIVLSLNSQSKKYFRKFAERYDFPFEKELIKRRTSGVRFKNIPSLVVPPEAFDFPRIYTNNLHFIGPIYSKSEKQRIDEGRLKTVVEDILIEKEKNPQVKLVYCSLGTVSANYLKTCKKFFNDIARVCIKNPDFRIILSVGKFFNISDIISIPQNLYVFDNVPQSALLEHCDIVINHGGINTIVECIVAEKPMIVYPLSLDWDQPGCAARVVYHSIGVKGVIRRANAKSIERLIKKVIAQEEFYVENVRKLKAKFVDKSLYTIELIDRIIQEGNPK